MVAEKSFKLSLTYNHRHYEGIITPSEKRGRDGIPECFHVVIDNKTFANLCCGDGGWTDREKNDQPDGLVNAIGNYILEYYE